jgi:hypothetical protein
MKALDIILIIIGVLVVIGLILVWPKPKIDIPKNMSISRPIQESTQPPISIPTNISIIQEPIHTPNNPISGTGNIPIITVETKTAPAGTVIIMETITQDGQPITDAECETDIINHDGLKVIDFRSFYNVGDGTMTYTWDNAIPGTYIISQYCWQGVVLDLNKIYNNSTLIIT